MNADHGNALILLAKTFAGIEAQEAVMTSVDRLGFHLRLKTQDGMRSTRIAFLQRSEKHSGSKRCSGGDGGAGTGNSVKFENCPFGANRF